MGTALALTLIPVAAAAVSGVVAVLRPPGERVTSGLQHFAAGVVYAAAAVELLPPVLQQAPCSDNVAVRYLERDRVQVG